MTLRHTLIRGMYVEIGGLLFMATIEETIPSVLLAD